MLDWGQWLTAGRAVPGLYSTSQWPDGKPVAHKVSHKRNKFTKPSQPHETRQTTPKIPVIVKFERDLERIHPVILSLDDNTKEIVVYLYLRGMCFADIRCRLGISSRTIGNHKYLALQSVSPVVR